MPINVCGAFKSCAKSLHARCVIMFTGFPDEPKCLRRNIMMFHVYYQRLIKHRHFPPFIVPFWYSTSVSRLPRMTAGTPIYTGNHSSFTSISWIILFKGGIRNGKAIKTKAMIKAPQEIGCLRKTAKSPRESVRD